MAKELRFRERNAAFFSDAENGPARAPTLAALRKNQSKSRCQKNSKKSRKNRNFDFFISGPIMFKVLLSTFRTIFRSQKPCHLRDFETETAKIRVYTCSRTTVEAFYDE